MIEESFSDDIKMKRYEALHFMKIVVVMEV
jgi:hypothetical protein